MKFLVIDLFIETFIWITLIFFAYGFKEEETNYCNYYYETCDNISQIYALRCSRIYSGNTSVDPNSDIKICNENNITNSRTKYDYLRFFNCPLKSNAFKTVQSFKFEKFISKTNTPVLENNVFDGLCDVKIIDLRNNNIERIEPEAFKCLTNIETLFLSNNKIQNFTKYVFRGMHKLKNIDLSGNKIYELSYEDFSYEILYNLEKLIMSRNDLRIIKSQDFTFTLTVGIYYLDVSENEFLNLNTFSFSHYLNLQILIMKGCNISHLPKDVFKQADYVKNLYLSHNRIKYISKDHFSSLKYLTLLDLSFNMISILKDETFKQNNFLVALTLSHNNLSFIERNCFVGLVSLEYLYMRANYLVEIPNLGTMKQLNFLDLSDNSISSLSEANFFEYNTELKELNVSSNKLKNINNIHWHKLQYLESLIATNNEITELYIPELSNDLTIHLESNQIQDVYISPENYINNESSLIKAKIFLSENPLKCDCGSFELHKFLTENQTQTRVEFVDNLICQNPPKYRGKSLKSINSDELGCKSCPVNCTCHFRVYDHVENIINCSHQSYENLPYVTSPNVSILYINQNNLKSLANLSGSSWNNLIELYAEGNQIESITFQLPRYLKLLRLHDNKMTTLPLSVETRVKEVETFKVTLSNNPWTCDCPEISVRDFLSDYKKQVIDVQNISCIFTNKTISSKNLLSMTNYELCTRLYLDTLTVYASIISVLLLLLISALAFYYRNKLHLLSFLYVKCYYVFWCCNQDKDDTNKLFDCFISYSSDDTDITVQIIEKLEKNPPYYSFCIHDRNWLPGEFITKNILISIQNSRKTLIILSKKFVKSRWFHLEFEAAFQQTLKDKKNRLIFVLKGEMPEESELEENVRHALSTVTYLQWGEKCFWDKLKHSLGKESNCVYNTTAEI